eukprot:3339833-Alexandrium_andersonii.AAC.1
MQFGPRAIWRNLAPVQFGATRRAEQFGAIRPPRTSAQFGAPRLPSNSAQCGASRLPSNSPQFGAL